jgi:hypothetical protein
MAMRRIVTGIQTTVTQDTPREAEVIADPLFRFNDPARRVLDGTVWGFGKTGRPAALLSLSLFPRGDGSNGWLYEFNSLTNRSVEAKKNGAQIWLTRQPGLEFKELPDAPVPADAPTARSRQFRDMSSRFTSFLYLRKDSNAERERFELRLIPHPAHRYADSTNGLTDGAIFFFTHGTNPEAAMLIELVQTENNKAVWKCAFTPISYAELHVELDGKEVWTTPQLLLTVASDPYYLFAERVQPGELTKE